VQFWETLRSLRGLRVGDEQGNYLADAEEVREQRQRRERQRCGENELSAVAHEVKVYSRAEPP
jgi:hypothetical protein